RYQNELRLLHRQECAVSQDQRADRDNCTDIPSIQWHDSVLRELARDFGKDRIERLSADLDAILHEEQLPASLAGIDDQFLLPGQRFLHRLPVKTRFSGPGRDAKSGFSLVESVGVALRAADALERVGIGLVEPRPAVSARQRHLLVAV